MALILTSEQQLLRDNARDFVQQNAPVNHLRRLRDQRDADGFSRELWRQMADFGWASSFIPEAYGGMGLGYTELGVVLEECGRTLAPTPLLSSVLLGAGTILEGGDEAQKRAFLPGVCAGTKLLALAFEETPRFHPHHVACKAERVGSEYRITGQKSFVVDGHAADHLIVSARTSGATDERAGISLFVVDAGARGMKLQPTRLIDGRYASKCVLEAVSVPESALVGTAGRGADVLEPVLDRAAICLSAEMFGTCSQAYETTLEYLKTRVQFDQPIGSFQALQHRAVDMFCALELAKSVLIDGLSAIDERRAELPKLASAVKARMSELSKHVTRESIQMHGGIGMTDEHDIGFYLKRGATNEITLGDAAYHRDRYATLSGF
jgi:alkylation response protein AidB-like acyl-CoA dehydrogenase